jgi:hypothetical protein
MDGPAQSHTTDAPAEQTLESRATHLRNLLAVATALRRLALDANPREAALYLAAAGTLENQAARLAGLLPEDEDTPRLTPPKNRRGLHKPVDFHI